jgi:formylglycine-generating enzyme required for sulfatase activity
MRQERNIAMMKANMFILCVVHLLLSGGIALAADPAIKDKTPVIELVLVKGGCYQMGDVFGDGNTDEKPVHEVCVKDFYLGKYEVTQEQWQKVMGDNPSEFKQCGKNCPVDSVSWDMAQAYITKLNAMTKKKYRLPTEAELEYAARSGGKDEKWPGANSPANLGEYVWYANNSNETTHPVGLKKPNGLGLYDMAGNVREWCQDKYHEAFYAKSPKDNPKSSLKVERHSQRGGGWEDDIIVSRTTARKYNDPDYNYHTFGLRLVLPVR